MKNTTKDRLYRLATGLVILGYVAGWGGAIEARAWWWVGLGAIPIVAGLWASIDGEDA